MVINSVILIVYTVVDSVKVIMSTADCRISFVVCYKDTWMVL